MDMSSIEQEFTQAIEDMSREIDTLQKLVQNLTVRINALEIKNSDTQSPGIPVVKMDAGIRSPLGKSIGGLV